MKFLKVKTRTLLIASFVIPYLLNVFTGSLNLSYWERVYLVAAPFFVIMLILLIRLFLYTIRTNHKFWSVIVFIISFLVGHSIITALKGVLSLYFLN